MNAVLHAWLPPAFDSLLHATWQGALLAAIVWGITRTVGQRLRAGWRFALWLVVFGRLALPWIPATPWSVYALVPHARRTSLPPASAYVNRAPRQAVPDDRVAQFNAPGSDREPEPALPLEPGPFQRSGEDAQPPVTSSNWFSGIGLANWCTLVWLGGFVVLACRLVWLHVHLERQRAHWQMADAERLQDLFRQTCVEAQVRRPVRLQLSGTQSPATTGEIGPATCGIVRPCVVLPARLVAALSPDELPLVLLHELIHVRRHDALLDLTGAIIAALHWFNPFAWLALGELRRERELACDEALLALRGIDSRRHYGAALLRTVELLQPSHALAGAVAMFETPCNPRSLEGRIRMITEHRQAGRQTRIAGALIVLALALVGLSDAGAFYEGENESARGQATNARPPAASERATSGSGRTAPAGKTMAIIGTCRDQDGQPVSRAKVVLFRVDSLAGVQRVSAAETPDSGRFEFANLEAMASGDSLDQWYYAVVAAAPKRASVMRYVISYESNQPLEIAMGPAATLSGRVVDPEGKPVAGARLWTGGSVSFDDVLSATTDTDGRFAITDLAEFDGTKNVGKPVGNGAFQGPTTCFLTIQHPDFAQKRPGYTRVPGKLEVALTVGARIGGQVVDDVTGKPAANAIVSMQATTVNLANGSDDGGWHQTITAADGTYRFEGLASASYNIWASAPKRTCVALDSVFVLPGERKSAADITLIAGGLIEGRVLTLADQPVTRGPQPANRLHIGLHGPSRPKSGAGVESTIVDEHGRFRFRVAPGLNFPYIMSDAWQKTWRRETFEKGVEVKAGETVSVVFRVLDKEPRPERDEVQLPPPVASERAAAEAIRDLGGWYQLDDDGHVVEVNMVYHQTADGKRYDNRQSTDEALAILPEFKALKRLYLKGAQASNAGFRHIAALPELELLLVWDAQAITDDGVAHLRTLRKLKALHLHGAGVTDRAIEHLSEIRSLERITMDRAVFTIRAFEFAKRLPHLKQFHIDGGPWLTDEGLKHVAQMPALEVLWLQRAAITDAGLLQLRGLKSLRFVQLSAGAVSDMAIEQLQEALPGLKVSAGQGTLPSRIERERARDPKQIEINRAEAPNGARLIAKFLNLASAGQDAEAGKLAEPYLVAELKTLRAEPGFKPVKVTAVWGDSEAVLAVTTGTFVSQIVDATQAGGIRPQTSFVLLRASQRNGEWRVTANGFQDAGSNKLVEAFLKERPGAKALSLPE